MLLGSFQPQAVAGGGNARAVTLYENAKICCHRLGEVIRSVVGSRRRRD